MSILVPPDETQLERVKKEYFYRPPDEVEEDITQLIEWLSKQPHLPNITDRKWLFHFITGCKYNLQKSKQVIESYFIVRAEHPEFYGSFTEKELKEVTKQGMMSVLPKMTADGYRVVYIRSIPMAEDFEFDVVLFVKAGTTLLDLQLKEEPVYGNIFMFDLKYFRMYDFVTISPTFTKNVLKCFLDSFPLRLKSIHIVNPPTMVNSIVAFFKMFLPKKIKERIFVHDSLKSLHQYIPREVLPDIYGGFDGDIKKNEKNAIDLMMSNKKWLDERPKADLSKRPRHITSNDLGMNGTFKKLQFD